MSFIRPTTVKMGGGERSRPFVSIHSYGMKPANRQVLLHISRGLSMRAPWLLSCSHYTFFMGIDQDVGWACFKPTNVPDAHSVKVRFHSSNKRRRAGSSFQLKLPKVSTDGVQKSERVEFFLRDRALYVRLPDWCLTPLEVAERKLIEARPSIVQNLNDTKSNHVA